MVKPLVVFLILTCLSMLLNTQAKSTIEQPQLLKSLEIQNPQKTPNACSYTVTIKTSCSSTSFTRDKISISFGDAYGYQVYAPRIDDPSSRTFERCSTDTFQIAGPCMYGKICYIYLLRVGSDGWKPDSVTITAGRNYKPVKFNYNAFVPYGVWYGFNLCPRNDLTISAV
ncbi:Embryo-specific protein ats3a [Ranunculus cassubicifolius]